MPRYGVYLALEGRGFSVCVGAQRRIAFASSAALLCFVVRLAGLRVCGVGAKGCSSHVARAHFAFRSSWLAGARVVAVRRVSRRGLAIGRRPQPLAHCGASQAALSFLRAASQRGCRSNYSVKRTPVNRLRSSKWCGRRRLPQALALSKFSLPLVILVCAVCAPVVVRAAGVTTTARDAAVLSAVIQHQCARSLANGHTKYMILATRSASIDTPVVAAASGRSAIASLRQRNRSTQALPRNISLACFKTLPPAKLAKVLPKGDWQHFHKALPSAWGIFRLSLPGYSRDGKTALVQGSTICGPLCANGFYWVLRLVRGKWQVISSEPTWVS